MRRALRTLVFLVGMLDLCCASTRPLDDMTPTSPVPLRVMTPSSAASGPTIPKESIATNLADYPSGSVPRYSKFEISFVITGTTATNPYFPYDDSTPPGVEAATGISVDALLLPPGEADWDQARTLPCFYYQPAEEVGSGQGVAYLPVGDADWRCRFSPDVTGTWSYRIRATDAGGSSESAAHPFDCATSDSPGFVTVSATDSRFFAFSDGTPFTSPLVSLEQGNPFNTLAQIRENIRNLGEHGVRFVRWFPTGEGANYLVAPFGDAIKIAWGFGDSWSTPDDADTAAGKRFSYRPYYYSAQSLPVVGGASYRLSFRAKVTGERVLRAQIGSVSGGRLDVCSSTSTYHESHGEGCDDKQAGWQDYTLEVTSPSDAVLSVAIRGLYVSSDAPSPHGNVQEGKVRVHSIRFQRYEADRWGPNLLMRSDPDTYDYVDQRSAAKLDEIFRLSEEYGVYHKLPLFHKNDLILNRLLPDGSVGDWDSLSRSFYSAEGQASRWYQRAYARYFVARWSYSPSLHSLELANENYLNQKSYEAGFSLAEFIHGTSPRHILMSNSFWGYFVGDFWADPDRGHWLDYADKHWYANGTSTQPELISIIWDDSAAYVRECHHRFIQYADWFDYRKPIVRGEGGAAETGTGPQHPEIAAEPEGIYYHKKLWSHVGTPGYTCDGEWYPRLFVPPADGRFPNAENDPFLISAAYERFMAGEPAGNGDVLAIGTDVTGDERISIEDAIGSLRAWGMRRGDRAILWIDNADHTWKHVADGVVIPPASASLVIPGFVPGRRYDVRWWNTYAFDPADEVIGIESLVARSDGTILVHVDDLGTDIAAKIGPVANQVCLPLVQSNMTGTR